MKPLTCLLLFAALTYEDSTFGSGSFHTVLAFQEPFFAGNPLKPWDVAVILVGLASLLRPKSWRQQVAPLNLALLGCTAGLLMMVGWGVARGGDVRMAYFQLAGLLRMLLLYPVVQAVFRTPRDLGMLALTILAAALYRGAACIVGHRFFLANLGTIEWPEYITDHHDSVLWTVVVIGLVSFLLARHRLSTALLVAPIATVVLLGIHYNERRLAWLQLVGGLGLVLLLTPPGRLRRRLNRWAVIAAPVVLVYVAAGWGRSGAVFAPVRQISSMFNTQTDDSNIYRDLENAGVIVTLQRTRALGTGFGHPFQEVSDRYSAGMASGWDEYRFTPHNSVLGLASAAGAIGFRRDRLPPRLGLPPGRGVLRSPGARVRDTAAGAGPRLGRVRLPVRLRSAGFRRHGPAVLQGERPARVLPGDRREARRPYRRMERLATAASPHPLHLLTVVGVPWSDASCPRGAARNGSERFCGHLWRGRVAPRATRHRRPRPRPPARCPLPAGSG